MQLHNTHSVSSLSETTTYRIRCRPLPSLYLPSNSNLLRLWNERQEPKEMAFVHPCSPLPCASEEVGLRRAAATRLPRRWESRSDSVALARNCLARLPL